jgi:ubiquinone/menaquinone biosynthesis C-methylase UbiE
MPYDNEEFDLVLCTDVLEHIPEWDIPNTLKELHRVCGDKLFVSVGMHQERSPFKGYIYTHITLKPKDWWLGKIQDVGFNINYAKEHSFHLHIKANKEK